MTDTTEHQATPGERFRELFIALGEEGEAALERLETVYAEQMQFQDPLVHVHDRKEYVEVLRRLIRRARAITVEVDELLEREGTLFATWTMTIEPRVGPTMTVDGATHATLRDGRITHQRDYWDLASSALDAVPGMGLLYRRMVALFV